MVEMERGKLLEELRNNVETLCHQLQSDEGNKERSNSEQFCREDFWKNIAESSKHISHEATKLSLMYSKPPLPKAENLEPMCRATEMSCLALLSMFYKLPLLQGSTLKRQLKGDILAIIRALSCFLTELCDYEQKGKGQLQVTGNVWENCQKLGQMPKDNKNAVLHLISLHDGLIKDALQELDEAIRENLNIVDDDNAGDDENCELEDFENKWNSNEEDIAKAALGLVKTAQTCTKKAHQIISSNAKTDDFQDQLDEISDLVGLLSPVVDDFVASLYPPMRIFDVMADATVVAARIKSILEAIKKSHCFTDADVSWWEFLMKATNHNLEKVENLTGKSRLG